MNLLLLVNFYIISLTVKIWTSWVVHCRHYHMKVNPRLKIQLKTKNSDLFVSDWSICLRLNVSGSGWLSYCGVYSKQVVFLLFALKGTLHGRWRETKNSFGIKKYSLYFLSPIELFVFDWRRYVNSYSEHVKVFFRAL